MLARRATKRFPTERYSSCPIKEKQYEAHPLFQARSCPLPHGPGSAGLVISSQTTRTLTMYLPMQVQWVLTCAAPPSPAEITPASALELPHCRDTCVRGARPAKPGPSTAFHTRRQPVEVPTGSGSAGAAVSEQMSPLPATYATLFPSCNSARFGRAPRDLTG